MNPKPISEAKNPLLALALPALLRARKRAEQIARMTGTDLVQMVDGKIVHVRPGEWDAEASEDFAYAKPPRVSALARLRERADELRSIAAAHGAHNVRVVGSVARGTEREDSDIDLLVTFDPGVGLLEHAKLVMALEELLDRKVDVASDRGVRSAVRQRLEADAETL